MTYIKDNLMPNEKILFSAHVHPAIFIPSVASFFMTLIILIYPLSLLVHVTPAGSPLSGAEMIGSVLLCFCGFLVFTSLLLIVRDLIYMLTTEFAVTNRRVIGKTGFLRRHSLEMLLPKIESVAVHQNGAGRMLNFGTVTVIGTGGTRGGFSSIAEPLAVRRKINQIIEDYPQPNAQQQIISNPGIVG